MGCQTASDGSSRQARVVIENRSADEVQAVVLDVFEQNSYEVMLSRPGRMIFEKSGSRMDEVAYGSWLHGETALRVEVTIRPHEGVSQLVEAKGRLIRAAGTYFEDETPQFLQRQARYRKLLDEVARRL